eukprot:268031-Chlamydomonas_euryale.AAC.2
MLAEPRLVAHTAPVRACLYTCCALLLITCPQSHAGLCSCTREHSRPATTRNQQPFSNSPRATTLKQPPSCNNLLATALEQQPSSSGPRGNNPPIATRRFPPNHHHQPPSLRPLPLFAATFRAS